MAVYAALRHARGADHRDQPVKGHQLNLPEASLARVLRRADAIWSADQAPHHLLLGQSGSGKTTLMKALLDLCPYSRTLVLDPKPHADPVWDGPDGDRDRWGKPVTEIGPRFGHDGPRGGGPHGLRYRLVGSPDRKLTAQRFSDVLDIVSAEGHVVLCLDDVREICRQLKLTEQVDSVLNLGRSNNILVILAATELGYVSGRQQGSQIRVGKASGLGPAKDGAALLGHSGKEWYSLTAAVPPHGWIYSEDQPGNQGPVFVPPEAA
jgi:energy-coupling factor transporter ATP-binding protein EcfA2